MFDDSYGWPHKKTLGKRPENSVQQTTPNIPVGKVEKLLTCVFLLLLLLPPKNKEDWSKNYSPWSFIVVRSNNDKIKKKLEKNIPCRRHYLRLLCPGWKAESSCRQAEEVADAVVALIFHITDIEKRIHPTPCRC